MKKQSDITPEIVGSILSGLGFSLPDDALTVLAGYLSMVQKWNKVMNLVGPYSWREILTSLMIDSLHLARFLETLTFSNASTSTVSPFGSGSVSANASGVGDMDADVGGASPCCWDFGAGAGLPGIPLRAVWRLGSYHMVDAREKRTMFMKQVLARYPLENTYVHNQRVEEFMEGREPVDLLVSRAFMPWQKLLELMQGRIAPAGRIVFLTLEDVPAVLPHGWQTEASASYEVDGTKRYFWSLTPINAPS